MGKIHFDTAEIVSAIVGFFSFVSLVIYAFKKNGFITFGKPKERRNCIRNCPDHDHLVLSINDLHENQVKISDKVNDIAVDVSFIKGKIEQL